MAGLPLFSLGSNSIDSILTIWLASTKQQTTQRGGSDEAARLFPQQRVIPGQDRAEPEGAFHRTPRPSSSQGRTVRARLSRDQPAGAGADAGERRRRDPDPVARHHRMAGRNSPHTATATEGSAAARKSARLCHGARLRYPSGAKSQSSGAPSPARPARGEGDGVGGLGQPRGAFRLRDPDRG